jgi:hypothetical protein
LSRGALTSSVCRQWLALRMLRLSVAKKRCRDADAAAGALHPLPSHKLLDKCLHIFCTQPFRSWTPLPGVALDDWTPHRLRNIIQSAQRAEESPDNTRICIGITAPKQSFADGTRITGTSFQMAKSMGKSNPDKPGLRVIRRPITTLRLKQIALFPMTALDGIGNIKFFRRPAVLKGIPESRHLCRVRYFTRHPSVVSLALQFNRLTPTFRRQQNQWSKHECSYWRYCLKSGSRQESSWDEFSASNSLSRIRCALYNTFP